MNRKRRVASILAEAQESLAPGQSPDVEDLCRRHPDLADELRRCIAVLPLIDRAVTPAPVPGPLPERMGGYRIVRELSRGGMGVVYLAEDVRIGRTVALKALSPELAASPRLRARIQREAEFAGKLHHPHICTVYETGEHDGVPFIAMRLVQGSSLADLVEEARREGREAAVVSLPPGGEARAWPATTSQERRRAVDRLLHLVEAVARALHVAHEAGLVHRDIKPSNIMVTDAGEPVVLDFGLATEEESGSPSLTETGTLPGTPAYMSPEQVAGIGARPDRRTDVYSLGVTLYECLTLRLPYDAPTRGMLFQKILSSEPEDPRRLNPDVGGDLAVVLATALEKDRDRRYRTALDFAEDLRRVRTREPIRARPVSPLVRLGRWAQRNPALAASGATLFLALGTGLAVSLDLLEAARRERDSKEEALAGVTREKDAKERALAEREEALRRADRALAEKDDAMAAMDRALEEKDGALRERGDALQAKEEALEVSGKALRSARVRALVNASAAVQEANPMQSLLLARVAAIRERNPDTLSRLHEALMASLEDRWMTGHTGWVKDVCFSPAGDRVLSASEDGTARLWNLRGDTTAVLQGHTKWVNQAIFLPPGDRVVTVSTDATGRIFDLEGRETAVLRGHLKCVHGVACTAAGDRIVTASCDGTARVWDPSGREIAVLRAQGTVKAAAFSPAGDRVLTAHTDGTARIWGAAGKELTVLRGHQGDAVDGQGLNMVLDGAFSPRGDRVLTRGNDGTARVWDLAGTEVLCLGGGGSRYLIEAAFAPSGDRVFAGFLDGEAGLYDLEGRPVARFRGHQGGVMDVAFSAAGDRILTAAADKTARLWDPEGNEIAVFRGNWAEMNSCDLNARGDLAVTGSEGSVKTWRTRGSEVATYPGWGPTADVLPGGDRVLRIGRDLTSLTLSDLEGRVLATLGGFRGIVSSQDCSPGGDLVAASSIDGTVRLWDLQGNERAVLRHGRSVAFVRFSPSGDRLLTGSGGKDVRIWDLAGREVGSVTVGGVLADARLSPQGDRIAVGLADGTIRILDLEGRETRVIRAEGMASVVSVCFSPSGDRILSISRDLIARLWDVSGRLVTEFHGHDGYPELGAFSPDGTKVLTLAGDAVARLWDTEGRLLVRYRIPDANITGLQFSPAGDRVITSASDGTVRTWVIDPGELLRLAEERSTREFLGFEAILYGDILEVPKEDPK